MIVRILFLEHHDWVEYYLHSVRIQEFMASMDEALSCPVWWELRNADTEKREWVNISHATRIEFNEESTDDE